MLIRIEAPHFVAGVDLYTYWSWVHERNCNTCPPILKYMETWDHYAIIRYCKRKGWKYTLLGRKPPR